MNSKLIIDFDSTFIQDETLDEIASIVSNSDTDPYLKEKISDITNQAMEGKLDFNSALKTGLKRVLPSKYSCSYNRTQRCDHTPLHRYMYVCTP